MKMIKRIKYLILLFCFILLGLAVFSSWKHLKIRKAIRDIGHRSDLEMNPKDTGMIIKLQWVLSGQQADDIILQECFSFKDLTEAFGVNWKQYGITYYVKHIELKGGETEITYIGYFPGKNSRKTMTVLVDSVNMCKFINRR